MRSTKMNLISIFFNTDFKCPETNGFFPDLEQCDLYYECVDNVPEAKLCPGANKVIFTIRENKLVRFKCFKKIQQLNILSI